MSLSIRNVCRGNNTKSGGKNALCLSSLTYTFRKTSFLFLIISSYMDTSSMEFFYFVLFFTNRLLEVMLTAIIPKTTDRGYGNT